MDASTSPTTERSATARVHDPQARAPRRAYRRRGTRLVQRSPALDLFRGLVMAGMIIVGSIRTFPEVRPVLHHAPWRGLTVVDLGLPFLLFIVGVAAQLSLQSRRRAGQSDAGILRHAAGRATMLVIIGKQARCTVAEVADLKTRLNQFVH